MVKMVAGHGRPNVGTSGRGCQAKVDQTGITASAKAMSATRSGHTRRCCRREDPVELVSREGNHLAHI